MPSAKTTKAQNSRKKSICRCGCGQNVTSRTERNHLQGKAGPLVKAHHAARRLAVLGLSPGRKKRYTSQSPIISPRKLHSKRVRTLRADSDHGMDLDGTSDTQGQGLDDELPVYFPGPDHDNMELDPGRGTPDHGAQVACTDLYDVDAVPALRQATVAMREGVWSNGHRVLLEDEPEDEDEHDDSGSEDEENFWGGEEEYDEYEWLYGLPAGDIIDEDMERELAEFAEELSDDDLAILRAFALKTEDNLTNATFDKLPFTFPDSYIPTLKVTKARIEFLAAFKPIPYDCCPNSCCCYVGPHAEENKCPYCNEPRFKSNGKARKTFTYVPLIPRLVASSNKWGTAGLMTTQPMAR
ncbi:hypothetical protein K438DRAFT_2077030 [Mycena galopus ATCC 62051]|nr:hypothetical protein K438DRAFT_2077030 [Mycena galopus ATCC 62051]